MNAMFHEIASGHCARKGGVERRLVNKTDAIYG
jgi:hypothetical protein